MKYPTTPDTTIRAGDRVRSYDFHGIDNCYIEGVVLDITTGPDARYHIAVDKVVFDGEQADFPHDWRVVPPVNGRPSWGSTVTCGVEKLGPDDQWEWMTVRHDQWSGWDVHGFKTQTSGVMEGQVLRHFVASYATVAAAVAAHPSLRAADGSIKYGNKYLDPQPVFAHLSDREDGDDAYDDYT